MTATATEGFDIAETCQLCGEMGVLIGQTGVGKTTFAKEYTRQNAGVILIEADVSYTAKGVFSELHQRCGGNGAASLSKMKDDIIERLRDSGRLIICDEAEFLPVRAIDLLRRIHDKAGIGILFVGLPRLFEGLFRKRGDYAYILSRISAKAVMGPLSLEDVSKIVSQGGVTDPVVCQTFLEASGGNARKLRLIFLKCMKSRDYEPGRPITPDVIRQKAARLLI
ncbi:MAG: AAA family ATPase [Syntrophales bacterium]|nr:AAA family ATPase [Syntrophales bacterium]